MFTSSLLAPLPHGFLNRQGGVSQAPYDSLSFVVNKGDDLENVRKNREIALTKLGLQDKELVTVNQVHGTKVIVVEEPWGFDKGLTPNADALVTQNPDVVLGVFTADCVPILLYDDVSKTIGAVHSGWKGTCAGVVKVAVEHMIQLGSQAKSIKAAIGPCIHQEDYEVSEEVYDAYMNESSGNAKFFKPSTNDGRFMLDLPGSVLEQLLGCGVGGVDMMELNTYAMEDQFFSCRRSFHQNQSGFGCMLSAISLPKENKS